MGQQQRIHLPSRKHRLNPWVRKIPLRREWQTTPVFLPSEFHEQKDLASYSPWGRKESDTTERLTHTHVTKNCHLKKNRIRRKVMTNLDSILKSRGITLPTKIRLVKAMVFPVVMYGCESWTVKKAEH